MPATGSIPTATPWRWSERLRTLGVTGLLVAAVAGCVATQQRYYVPTEGQGRVGTDEMKDQAEMLLRVECPRLLGGSSSALGEAQLLVDVDGGGRVSRARVVRSSGDEKVDAIFGGVVAQLEVDAPSDGTPTSGRVNMGYSCAPNSAVVTVRGIQQLSEGGAT